MPKKFIPVFIIFFAGVLLSGPGCVSKKNGQPIARFDGAVITDTDLQVNFSRLPKELRGVISRKRQGLLDEMINEHFLVKEARRRNLRSVPDVKDLLAEAERKILIAKLIEMEVDKKVSLDADEARKYYDSHKDEFMTPLLLRASHILVKTEPEASALRTQLDGGADFEELARKQSLDQSSVRGGDIGFFQRGQLIPEFEQVAFSLKKGEISPIFQSPFGFHILKVTDRAEPAIRDFKIIRTQLEKQLLNQKRSRLFGEFTDKLKAGSKIQIDDKALAAVELNS